LVAELRANEHVVHVVGLEELRSEHRDMTDALKGLAGYASTVDDAGTVRHVLEDFGLRPGRVVLKEYGGEMYVIFKGTPGQRRFLRGTRYLASNPKVVRFAIGPRGIAKSVRGGFVLTAVLSVGLEVFGYFIRDRSTLHHLLGTITADLVKIGLGSLAAWAVTAQAMGFALVASTAAAPLLIAIVVGAAASLLLNELDASYGVTRALIDGYQRMGVYLGEVRREAREAVQRAERSVGWLERHPRYLPCLFGPCSVRGY
jgi:hypothetical protein